MKIYLASPFFNDNEIANIHRAVEILKAKGHEVFVPMEHDVENRESLTNAEWAEEIFKIDKGGIDDCDAVGFALRWNVLRQRNCVGVRICLCVRQKSNSVLL